MDDFTTKIRVGTLVVVATIACFLLVLFFGEKKQVFQSDKTVYMWFASAPGATAETPVRKNGVLVGRVQKVELRDEGGVLITARINNAFKIRRKEAVVIRTGSLIGDAVLEFVPDKTSTDETLIEDQEYIANTAVANDPIQVLVNLEQKVGGAIAEIERTAIVMSEAGNRIGLLAENVNQVVANNGDQFHRIIQKTEVAMDHFHSAMRTIDDLVGDPELKAEMKTAIRGLPSLFEDARGTLSDARKTLAAFQQMSQRADTNLQNLEKFTKPLADRGDQLVKRIEGAVGNIGELLEQLVSFSESLNSKDGSLGQLLHDRELYDRLKRTANNVEDATRQLRPILTDVRVLTSKLADDPRQLGLKGALDRRQSGAGNSFSGLKLEDVQAMPE